MSDDLFDWANTPARSAMFKAYREWDARNPHFYPLFCRFAKQLADRGHRAISSKLLFERIRWESFIRFDAGAGDAYKLNNNYTAIYARRFMRDHPEHEGLFRLRELHAISESEAEAA